MCCPATIVGASEVLAGKCRAGRRRWTMQVATTGETRPARREVRADRLLQAALHGLGVRRFAAGAVAFGAVAAGAFALGAFAVGALAIGRLAVGRARIRRLEIDELVVRNRP
jgi:hypothetical protein